MERHDISYYQELLCTWQKVESTQETCDAIMQAIEMIMSWPKSRQEVFIALDDIKNKAFVCLYKEPLEADYEVIHLVRNWEWVWNNIIVI